jgi:hypothetical protein
MKTRIYWRRDMAETVQDVFDDLLDSFKDLYEEE